MTQRIQGGATPTGELKRPTAPMAAAAAEPAPAAGGTGAMAKDAFVRQSGGAGGAAPQPAAPPIAPVWNFVVSGVRRFYDASNERTRTYDFGGIRADIPQMWDRPVSSDIRGIYLKEAVTVRRGETYGQLFKRVGAEMGVDPYAMAAYCVFESYNAGRSSFNPHMREVAGGMHAAGLAATQAQDWRGKRIPGTNSYFPKTLSGTERLLRTNPEYSLRCLAAEMKHWYQAGGQNLAVAFPRTAYPAWGSPDRSRGNYGTQAQYVSRAHTLYQAFKATDAAR